MSKKYEYNIVVPVTGAIMIMVNTEKPIDNEEEAYDLAMDAYSASGVSFALSSPDDKEVHHDVGDVMMGDEWDTHRRIVRGNVCYASCNEIEWELMGETESDDE